MLVGITLRSLFSKKGVLPLRAWVGRYVFRVLGSLARPGFETLPYHTLPYHTYRTMMDLKKIRPKAGKFCDFDVPYRLGNVTETL